MSWLFSATTDHARSFLQGSTRLLFPAHCTLCENYHEGAFAWVCEPCGAGLRSCASPIARRLDTPGGETIHVRAAWPFDAQTQKLIHALKYDSHPSVGMWLGRELALLFAPELREQGGDAEVVPVPLHRVRLRERGFNQSERLARGLGSALRLNVRPNRVRRSRATVSQTGLGRRERRKNVGGAFRARARRRQGGGAIVLVDDVLTTGATMAACAAALADAGYGPILGITAAFAQANSAENTGRIHLDI